MLEVSTNVGSVTQIIGTVLDIEFANGNLPKVYNAIDTKLESGTVEVCGAYPTLLDLYWILILQLETYQKFTTQLILH